MKGQVVVEQGQAGLLHNKNRLDSSNNSCNEPDDCLVYVCHDGTRWLPTSLYAVLQDNTELGRDVSYSKDYFLPVKIAKYSICHVWKKTSCLNVSVEGDLDMQHTGPFQTV